jgi:hypothetical protein
MVDNKQQTAVEWLMEQISYDNGMGERWISFRECVDLTEYFEQAKAMEKQQIIDATLVGWKDGITEMQGGTPKYKGANDYYKTTYEEE